MSSKIFFLKKIAYFLQLLPAYESNIPLLYGCHIKLAVRKLPPDLSLLPDSVCNNLKTDWVFPFQNPG